MKRTTLTDIARRAGVSVYTVSLALRGRKGVSAATAERIRAIARDVRYRPNAAAQLLVAARARTRAEARRPVVAVVRFAAATAEYNAQDARMKTIAEEEGFALEVFRLPDFGSPAALSRVLWARGAQGLILLTNSVPHGYRLDEMAGFEWDRFSLVKISHGFDALRCHTVTHSVFSQMRAALERVVAAGYRRTAVLLLSASASLEDDWGRLGAIEAFRKLRRRAFERMELFTAPKFADDLPEAIADGLRELRPDAVVVFPFAWRFPLEKAGYRIPEDFALVGVPVANDSPGERGRPTSGPLDDFLGQEFPAALHMLREQIAAGQTGIPRIPYEHVLPVVWQRGVTMPDPKPKASAPGK